MDEPTFVTVHARDLVPHKHAIWCTVGDCPEPFANEIVSVRWRDDGQIGIMLDSHNFDRFDPDALVECVVERTNLSKFQQERIATWRLPDPPAPRLDPADVTARTNALRREG